jgi:hypothetical protein
MARFVQRNIDFNQRADERWPEPSKSATNSICCSSVKIFAAEIRPLERSVTATLVYKGGVILAADAPSSASARRAASLSGECRRLSLWPPPMASKF